MRIDLDRLDFNSIPLIVLGSLNLLLKSNNLNVMNLVDFIYIIPTDVSNKQTLYKNTICTKV